MNGVVAVALGGSRARGLADEHSDIDIALYYRDATRPPLDQLEALARELDDSHSEGLVTPYGDWGPWINGGAWLQVGGRRVDWLYREIGMVRAVVEQCRGGVVTCDYQPGHPHGFHNHMYMAEVHANLPLEDPEGALRGLKALTEPYPEPMRRAIIDRYLWEAAFALETTRTAASRGDAFHVAGSVFRTVACLIQVLYAVNRRYFVNEKGAVAAIESFPMRPPSFSRTVVRLFDERVNMTRDLSPRLAVARGLLEEVREIVRLGYPSSP